MTDFTQLGKHLELIKRTVYTEPKFDWHEKLIDSSIDHFARSCSFTDVLDVGFGTGYSLGKFKELGMNAIGISVDESEVKSAHFLGYNVKLMDMAFLEFPDASFDLVWCRHAIEHTVMPMIVLMEFYRVLRNNGHVYIEVPSDNGIHLDNANHFSMLSDAAWQSLFRRIGFNLLFRGQFTGTVMRDETRYNDIYWNYWLRKGG